MKAGKDVPVLAMLTAPIDPGKPWQNGIRESFNGNFRDACLSLEWFLSREGRLTRYGR
jgi:hypothetical protein